VAALSGSEGGRLRHIGVFGTAPGQFNYPRGVAVVPPASSEGEVWLVVGDSGNHRVQVLTALGAVVRVLVTDDHVGPLSRLYGVAVCAGEVLVTDYQHHRVVAWRLDTDQDGGRVVCGGDKGDAMGRFNLPWGLVVTKQGAVWVSDRANHRLCMFR
jgi:hypothetical protein